MVVCGRVEWGVWNGVCEISPGSTRAVLTTQNGTVLSINTVQHQGSDILQYCGYSIHTQLHSAMRDAMRDAKSPVPVAGS